MPRPKESSTSYDEVHLPMLQPRHHSSAPRLPKRSQFTDNSYIFSGSDNSTRVRSHVLREYMRQKRWRELQRLKGAFDFLHIQGSECYSSSIGIQDLRTLEGQEGETGESARQQRAAVFIPEASRELVDCSCRQLMICRDDRKEAQFGQRRDVITACRLGKREKRDQIRGGDGREKMCKHFPGRRQV